MAQKRNYALAAAVVFGLGGCDQMQDIPLFKKKPEGEAGATAASAKGETVEKEVEAPEVFAKTEAGLWDGRPSLGGVWVAHPDVRDPERVIIRNSANGKSVIGALFRRERENPGPRYQVSSDAATALGMLAGAPAELSVVALRKKVVSIAPPPAEDTDIAPDAVDTETLDDPIASAAAAIDAAENTPSSVITPAAGTTAADSPLRKPYVQIGIFSVKANADRSAQAMRDAGLTPKVLAQQSQGKSFWRVIVGPAMTTGARADIQGKVRGLGYDDAYFVTN